MSEETLKEIRDLLIEIRDLLKSRSIHGKNANIVLDQENNEPSEKSWSQYLEEKNPNNDYEIIALVVGQLTNNGKPSVTKEEIIEFIRAHTDRIKNTEKLNGAINNTKNTSAYKYIEHPNKKDKTYRLSIKGEQLIQRLPDHEPPKAKKRK